MDKKSNHEKIYNKTETLISSVTRHLKLILNTRRGTVLIDPEYGMPDFSDLPVDLASTKTDIMKERIKQVVEKYESRIKDVVITINPKNDNNLSMHFGLNGTIIHENTEIPINLITTLGTDNKFDLMPITRKLKI
jgi:type VI secretion system protein